LKRGVQAVVPGSTSNLGPGFDLFGLALDLYLRVTVTVEGTFVMAGTAETEWKVNWEGEGSRPPDLVPTDEGNLVVRALHRIWEEAGVSLDGRAEITGRSEIPTARGLGASGAAIVAGLLAGGKLAEFSADRERLLALAVAEEGHPDNVTPSLHGGLTASAPLGDDGILVARDRLWEEYLIGAVVPGITISTRLAREALPAEIAHAEAVSSQQRSFFLFRALAEGRTAELAALTRDSLHQPYRARLIPACEDLLSLAAENGAGAVWISGSGPTLVVLAEGGVERIEAVCEPLVERWAAEGIESRTLILGPDDLGGAVHDI
jgi:homoserine kinase